MAIRIERVRADQVEECARAEAASGIGMAYVADVFDHFTRYTVGDLSCGYLDDRMVGIGKLTRLYDGSAWLETLRVDEAYQGQGVGKAFYIRFREEAKALNCPVMRMYTGLKNDVSAGLARANGFETVATHQGMVLDLSKASIPAEPGGFGLATPTAAMAAYAGKEAGFICLNRTFYKHGPDTVAGFAAEGRAFVDGAGSALMLGARFQREQGYHMAAPIGDRDRCIDFAISRTAAEGLPKLTCTYAVDDLDLQQRLAARGFVLEPSPTIVMEGKV